MAKTQISLTVNGKTVDALVEPRTLLIHFLREQLRLTGPHIGCETSHCGACTVDLDGKSVKSCTMFAVQANGADIRTIEGMAHADGTLHALQEAFREMHGLQCGFCTPGMIMRAYRLLQENPNPTEEEIRFGISGNLCRCTGYQNIVKAIQYAAAKIAGGRQGGRRMNDMTPTSEAAPRSSKAWAASASASRTSASARARATTSTTSSCPACSTATSSARPMRMRASRASTRSKADGGAGRRRGAHRRDAQDRQPRLDADARRRRADGARRRQGAVPEPGGRLRHRDRAATSRPTAPSWSRSSTRRCPSTSIRSRRWRADAPVIREDIKDKTDGAHGPRKHHNHVFTWQAGDKAATDAAFDKADVTIKELIAYPRCHPCPLETCQCVASFDKIKGELTLWGTFQAPHVIRTVGSLISKIPEHKIHVIAPDIGGGFGNKVGAYSGYICAIVASIVTGAAGEMGRGPHREPLDHGLRARLPHGDGDRLHQGRQGDRAALLHHRRPRRVRRLRQRHQVAGRALQHRHRARTTSRPRIAWSTASTPTRRRAASPIAARSASPRPPTHRARHGHHGAEARHGPGRVPHEEPDPARAVPLHVGDGLGIRFRRLSHRHAARRWTRSTTRRCAPSRRRSRRPSSAARRAS